MRRPKIRKTDQVRNSMKKKVGKEWTQTQKLMGGQREMEKTVTKTSHPDRRVSG
jgi:hypothetical protein